MHKKLLLALAVCPFFLCACGLEHILVVEAPNMVIHSPNYANIDYSENYFEFWTNEQGNDNDYFMGTDVYYKIYNNVTTMTSEVSSLNTTAGSSTTSANAPSQLMTTYKYQTLKVNGDDSSPLITKNDGTNLDVYIRLTTYQSAYVAEIRKDSTVLGTPGRNVVKSGNYLTFNFGRDGSWDVVPASDDVDVKYSSTATESGKWYVAMFAMAVGRDSTYTNYYSNILYLGSVTIDAGTTDN